MGELSGVNRNAHRGSAALYYRATLFLGDSEQRIIGAGEAYPQNQEIVDVYERQIAVSFNHQSNRLMSRGVISPLIIAASWRPLWALCQASRSMRIISPKHQHVSCHRNEIKSAINRHSMQRARM